MTNQQSNKELVKAGHAFAAAMDMDTPIIKIAKLVTELADRLDVMDACNKSLAAESHSIKKLIELHAAGFSVCSACGHEECSENDDVVFLSRSLDTKETNAILNAVRDEAIESQSDLMMWASLDEDIYANSPQGIAECLDLNPGDEFEVMVAARLPRRIYRMVGSGDIQLVHQLRADAAKDGE